MAIKIGAVPELFGIRIVDSIYLMQVNFYITGIWNPLEQGRKECGKAEQYPSNHCAQPRPRPCLDSGGRFGRYKNRWATVKAADDGHNTTDDIQPPPSVYTQHGKS